MFLEVLHQNFSSGRMGIGMSESLVGIKTLCTMLFLMNTVVIAYGVC